MSCHLRLKCWRAVFVCFLLLCFTGTVRTVPNHGGQLFSGYSYWNNRYSLGYPADWDGFWNKNSNGRNEYNRATSEFSGRSCGGCSCSNNEAVACSGPTV